MKRLWRGFRGACLPVNLKSDVQAYARVSREYVPVYVWVNTHGDPDAVVLRGHFVCVPCVPACIQLWILSIQTT